MIDTGKGFKYQLSVTAYLASLLSKNVKVKNYYIFYEIQEVQPFDDIVLAVQHHESEDFRLYLVQVKSGKVSLDLDKYLEGYNNIRQNKTRKFLEKIGKINKENTQFWYFACKNFKTKSPDISFKEDSAMKELELKKRESDRSESIINEEYSQKYKLCLKSATATTKHQDFFDKFYIYLDQPNTEKIICILGGMWKLNDPTQIIDYLDKYFIKYKQVCLSKTGFEQELLRIRLTNYIVTPIKVILFEKESAEAWINLTLSRDVTVVDNALHVEGCLFGCILHKLQDIITVAEWNSCATNEGKLSDDVKMKFSSKLFKPQTLKDLVIHFWMSNRIPLILKAEDDLPALADFSHLRRHFIVIDSNLQKRYDEMKRYNLSVIKDLEGLQAGELLRSIVVSMQGKKPATLYEIINGDESLLGGLTCSDILKLIEPKRVFLKNDCLTDYSSMVFIIENENTEEWNEENYKIIEDNIVMHCPPNQSEACYRKVLQNEKFKTYKICRLYSQNSDDSEVKLSLKSDKKSTNAYQGLEYFIVDQHGNNVYKDNENKIFPVIGEMINVSCPRYLTRRMRKGRVKHATTASSINNLNSLIEYVESPFWENDFFFQTNRKICVVTGEPGIGKSTSLRSLVQNCCPQHYVLFCDLALYQMNLYDENSTQSKLCSDPFNFLREKDNSLPYSKFLHAIKRNPNRLIIILDAVDQVLATCKENVIKLILKLNQESRLQKIIIGSRLLTVDVLSNRFDVDLVEIEGFSTDWNGDYVQNWNINEKCIRHVLPEFLKNPLYLNFLSVISARNINMDNVTRWTLYKTIIGLNIDLYYEHRNQNPDDVDRNYLLKYCYALALQAFLPYNKITKKLTENVKDKYINLARIGIIKCFDGNGVPEFVHHTFLEFLISLWLIETTDKEDAIYIYEYILRNRMHDILCIHSEQFRLHKAVMDKDVTQVERLCNENPELLRETDELGRTALHLAGIDLLYFKINVDIVTKILENTIAQNLNLYPCDKLLNWTWIDYWDRNRQQIKFRDGVLSRVILESYWNYRYHIRTDRSWLDVDDQHFSYFCYTAFKVFSISCIQNLFLLKFHRNKAFKDIHELCVSRSKASVTTPLPESWILELDTTLMHLGCIYTNINIIRACIERGDDVNARDRFGCTPLFYGVCSGNDELVKLLLEKGADTTLNPTSRVVTVFQMSLEMKNKNIMTMLIKSIEKSLQASNFLPPLEDAVMCDNTQLVEKLLKAGATVNVSNLKNDTLLHLAVQRRNKHLVQLFSRYQLNLTNKTGQTPLFWALLSCDTTLVEMLLKQGAHVNITDRTGATPLGISVKCSKDLIELLLRYGADVNGRNHRGETALFDAVNMDNTHKVKVLLCAGVNVNIGDRNGNTALHVAINRSYRRGFEETMISTLLIANADVNIVDKFGDTPLHNAVSIGFRGAVQLILQDDSKFRHSSPTSLNPSIKNPSKTKKYKTCVNMESQNGDTPLSYAIKSENACLVNILLENGADANYVDKNGRHLTPLFTAIETENLEVIDLLLRNGADVNYKDGNDVTPLYVAVLTRNLKLVELLLKYEARPHFITSLDILLHWAKLRSDVNSALNLLNYWAKRSEHPLNVVKFSDKIKKFIEAVEKKAKINFIDKLRLDREENHTDLTRALLKLAADIDNPFPIGIKCLNAVWELNSKEIDQILLRNFNERYKASISFYTSIGYATLKLNRAMIDILLRNGQTVNTISLIRIIPSSTQKYPIEILLENHIDVNLPDENGNTPLLLALFYSTADVVEILLENGASVNACNRFDPHRTPLKVAVEWNRTESVRMLLQKGANINDGDESLLHLATGSGNANIVRMLLHYGADPNHTDKYGQSILHYAVRLNRKDIVKVLREFKADVNIKDNDDLIPLSYAIAKNMREIIKLLTGKEEDDSDCNKKGGNETVS